MDCTKMYDHVDCISLFQMLCFCHLNSITRSNIAQLSYSVHVHVVCGLAIAVSK